MFELTTNQRTPEPATTADNFGKRALRLLLTVCTIAIAVMLFAAGVNPLGIATASAEERPSPDAELAQRYDGAMQAFVAQRYAVAYGRFAALADQGHAHSALMALAMVTYPPSLRGEWSATAAQLQRWRALAAHELDARATLITEYDAQE
ncbi:MAG TPA: hypothetical protein VFR86_14165 [Burkholderiaceae bacterium]|nr:hypothetical protein [Burkholderiaceae bacterium]